MFTSGKGAQSCNGGNAPPECTSARWRYQGQFPFLGTFPSAASSPSRSGIVSVCCSHRKMTGPASPPTSFAKQQPATLSRELGVSPASAIVGGTIIGSGIFLVPSEMMQAVGSAWLVYLAWIVGGVLS